MARSRPKGWAIATPALREPDPGQKICEVRDIWHDCGLEASSIPAGQSSQRFSHLLRYAHACGANDSATPFKQKRCPAQAAVSILADWVQQAPGLPAHLLVEAHHLHAGAASVGLLRWGFCTDAAHSHQTRVPSGRRTYCRPPQCACRRVWTCSQWELSSAVVATALHQLAYLSSVSLTACGRGA